MGANVLARFAVSNFYLPAKNSDILIDFLKLKLSHPDFVTGCAFINLVSTRCGWVEWGYQKWSNWYLGSGQFTEFTKNYLLWHHFGYVSY